MAASIPTFLQDNFLTCKICFNVYKEPKILVCLHSFCLRCLENHLLEAKNKQFGSIICPVCRERTLLSIDGVRSLKSNFYIKNLIEFVEASAFGKSPPQLTNDGTLCERKSENTEGGILQNRIHLCERHCAEIEEHYCHTCNISTCRLCVLSQHKSHDVTKSSDKLTEELSVVLRSANDKIESLKEYMSNIDGRREEIMTEQNLCIESVNTTGNKMIEKLKCETQRTVEDIKGRFHELDSKLTLLKEAGRKDLHMMESFVKTSIADVESGKYDLNQLKNCVKTTVRRFEDCLSKYQHDLTIKQKIRIQLTELAKCNEMYKLFEIVNDEPIGETKKIEVPTVTNTGQIDRHIPLTSAYKNGQATEQDEVVQAKEDEISRLVEVPDSALEREITTEENVVLMETVMSCDLTPSQHEAKVNSQRIEVLEISQVETEPSELSGSERLSEPDSVQEEVMKLNKEMNATTVPSFPLLQPSDSRNKKCGVAMDENLLFASAAITEEAFAEEMLKNKEMTSSPIEMSEASVVSINSLNTLAVNDNLPPKIPKRSILVRRSASLERKISRKDASEKNSEDAKQFIGWKLQRSNSLESRRTINHVKETPVKIEMNDRSTRNNDLINFFQCNDESDRMTVKLTAVQWFDSNTFVVTDESNCKLKYIRADNGQCLKSITVKNVASIARSKSLVVFGQREPRVIFINIDGNQRQVKLPFSREDVRPIVTIQNEELVVVVCTDRLLIVNETNIQEKHLTDLKDKPLRVKPMFASSYNNVCILVSDWLQHRICFLSDSGNLFQQIKMSSVPTSEGIFRTPGDLCADSVGNVYVVEYWKSVLVQFNSNGIYVRNINLRTYARLPKGISLLDDKRLLVASQNGVAILQIGE
ncbi:hypothetical protein FSP39_017543 [Pinctada imbricata]|uniref:Uncharacterized protein n=1 Tax=Pinctada imbricata TaxID=66713 RepID=A0AA89BRA5_PINIB|nr:hypothetical protein FSP39_017543 [Pinctada imbricata]